MASNVLSDQDFANEGAPAPSMSDEDFSSLGKPQAPGRMESVARGAQQGLLFNRAPQVSAAAAASGMQAPIYSDPDVSRRPTVPDIDPIRALVGAGRMGLEKLFPSTFGSSASSTYDQRLQAEKDRMKETQESHPNYYMAGQIAGSIPSSFAIPEAKAGQALANIGKAGGVSAALGALSGSGEGDTTQDKIRNAIIGGTTGGVLGGLAGGIAGHFAPNLPPTMSKQEIVDAANRQGIKLPFFAVSESPTTQMASQNLRSLPFIGAPLSNAARDVSAQLGQRAEDIAQTMGGFDKEQAGHTLSSGLKDWIGPVSKGLVSDKYNVVNGLINQTVTTPLNNTAQIAQRIQAARSASKLPDSPAVNFVQQAISDPNGLTYDGIKGLRTAVGEMLNGDVLPAGMQEGELKQIYGALSNDLAESVKNAGGKDALDAFNEANNFARETQQQRERLVNFLGGAGAKRADEGVFAALQRYASTSNSADAKLLAQAKSIMNPNDWQDISSGVVGQLGRDVEGNFSPSRFVTGYNKMSDKGKDILFGPIGSPIRDNLEDFSTVSSKLNYLQSFVNHSNTSSPIALVNYAVALYHHPYTTLASLIGGRSLSSFLSRPVTAVPMTRYSRAMNNFLDTGTDAALSTLKQASSTLSSTLAAETGRNIPPESLWQGPANLYQQYVDAKDKERTGRASGGRTNSKRDPKKEADRLINLAARIKKEQAGGTSSLLNLDDTTVAKALAVANRNI